MPRSLARTVQKQPVKAVVETGIKTWLNPKDFVACPKGSTWVPDKKLKNGRTRKGYCKKQIDPMERFTATNLTYKNETVFSGVNSFFTIKVKESGPEDEFGLRHSRMIKRPLKKELVENVLMQIYDQRKDYWGGITRGLSTNKAEWTA